MTAKEKAIQEAYQDKWAQVEHYVDSEGWLDTYVYRVSQSIPCEIHFTGAAERPLTLDGIENNNGWTRLDERHPAITGDYYVCIDGKFDGEIMHSHEIRLSGNPMNVSHWRPIDPVKPPIY